MTYTEAVNYIESFGFSREKTGLERARKLLALLGNPQNSLRFVHVAGSNGKGSTCAMVESVLREAGYKTGLFTSPYLQRFNERIKCNGCEIEDEKLAAITSLVRDVIESAPEFKKNAQPADWADIPGENEATSIAVEPAIADSAAGIFGENATACVGEKPTVADSTAGAFGESETTSIAVEPAVADSAARTFGENTTACVGEKPTIADSAAGIFGENATACVGEKPTIADSAARTFGKSATACVGRPTQFEVITAVAMLYYKEENCDVVVLEVGMGGEFDATNVIKVPDVAVITNIGLEHTQYLGDTLEKIAKAKGGIIKPGGQVVLYDGEPEVTATIEKICHEKGAELHRADFSQLQLLETGIENDEDVAEVDDKTVIDSSGETVHCNNKLSIASDLKADAISTNTCSDNESYSEPENKDVIKSRSFTGQRFIYKGKKYEIGLLGNHQLKNAAVAIETVEVLRRPITEAFSNILNIDFSFTDGNKTSIEDGIISLDRTLMIAEPTALYYANSLFTNKDAGSALEKSSDHISEPASDLDNIGFALKKFPYHISDQALHAGLKKATWPGRFEILSKNPLFILDGGHNPQCAAAMADTLHELLPGKKFVILLGIMMDKNYEKVLDLILPFADSFVCVTPSTPRAMPAGELAKLIKEKIEPSGESMRDESLQVSGEVSLEKNCGLPFDDAAEDIYHSAAKTIPAKTVEDGIRIAIEMSKKKKAQGENTPVLAFGSLYLAGEVRNHFSKP